MFEKFAQVAEQVATSASRRQFLGRAGQSALAIAGVLGGLLAAPGTASAGSCPPGTHLSKCSVGGARCCPPGTHCANLGWSCLPR
jgi:hypothetical protein